MHILDLPDDMINHLYSMMNGSDKMSLFKASHEKLIDPEVPSHELCICYNSCNKYVHHINCLYEYLKEFKPNSIKLNKLLMDYLQLGDMQMIQILFDHKIIPSVQASYYAYSYLSYDNFLKLHSYFNWDNYDVYLFSSHCFHREDDDGFKIFKYLVDNHPKDSYESDMCLTLREFIYMENKAIVYYRSKNDGKKLIDMGILNYSDFSDIISNDALLYSKMDKIEYNDIPPKLYILATKNIPNAMVYINAIYDKFETNTSITINNMYGGSILDLFTLCLLSGNHELAKQIYNNNRIYKETNPILKSLVNNNLHELRHYYENNETTKIIHLGKIIRPNLVRNEKDKNKLIRLTYLHYAYMLDCHSGIIDFIRGKILGSDEFDFIAQCLSRIKKFTPLHYIDVKPCKETNNINSLFRRCNDGFYTNISYNNSFVCNIAELALRYKNQDLLQYMVDYFEKRRELTLDIGSIYEEEPVFVSPINPVNPIFDRIIPLTRRRGIYLMEGDILENDSVKNTLKNLWENNGENNQNENEDDIISRDILDIFGNINEINDLHVNNDVKTSLNEIVHLIYETSNENIQRTIDELAICGFTLDKQDGDLLYVTGPLNNSDLHLFGCRFVEKITNPF